jgi:hypothetical protein
MRKRAETTNHQPDRLVIESDFETAMRSILNTKRPEGGWPKLPSRRSEISEAIPPSEDVNLDSKE